MTGENTKFELLFAAGPPAPRLAKKNALGAFETIQGEPLRLRRFDLADAPPTPEPTSQGGEPAPRPWRPGRLGDNDPQPEPPSEIDAGEDAGETAADAPLASHRLAFDEAEFARACAACARRGREEALVEGERRLRALADSDQARMADALSRAAAAAGAVETALDDALLDAAMAAARALVDALWNEAPPPAFEGALRDALASLDRNRRLEITLGPEIDPSLAERLRAQAKALGFEDDVRIERRADASPRAIDVGWPDGRMSFSRERLEEGVRAALAAARDRAVTASPETAHGPATNPDQVEAERMEARDE